MKAGVALRNLSLGKIFVNCLVGRSFAAEGFCVKNDKLLSLRKIQTVAATACSFNASLDLLIQIRAAGEIRFAKESFRPMGFF